MIRKQESLKILSIRCEQDIQQGGNVAAVCKITHRCSGKEWSSQAQIVGTESNLLLGNHTWKSLLWRDLHMHEWMHVYMHVMYVCLHVYMYVVE